MMTDEFQLVTRPPTVAEYQALRRAVGWPEVDPAAVETGLAHSLFAVCLLRGEDVVGCGRIVGDGGIYFYIQDVIVLPAYQRRGLGRRIMDELMADLARRARQNSFIGLMAAEGVARFYEGYGFKERPTGRPGMFRLWGP